MRSTPSALPAGILALVEAGLLPAAWPAMTRQERLAAGAPFVVEFEALARAYAAEVKSLSRAVRGGCDFGGTDAQWEENADRAFDALSDFREALAAVRRAASLLRTGRVGGSGRGVARVLRARATDGSKTLPSRALALALADELDCGHASRRAEVARALLVEAQRQA
jgi:hypothetical protein